jgi:hypothetical protein
MPVFFPKIISGLLVMLPCQDAIATMAPLGAVICVTKE